MSLSNISRPNNSAANLFLVVQMLAFLLFFFDAQVLAFTGTLSPIPVTVYYKNTPIVFAMLAFAVLTFYFLRSFPTPKAQFVEINFPYVLHCSLLVIEIIFIIYVRGDATSTEEARDIIYSGDKSLGLLKISSVFLYMTSMLLSAKLASLTLPGARILAGERTKIFFLVFLTFVIYVIKDVAVGSRGSLLNIICFYLGGWTFVRPFKFRFLFSPRALLIATVVFMLLGSFFYQLTLVRAGEIGLAIIHDTVLIKFSSNLAVIHEYLYGSLSVRSGFYSQWIPASEASIASFFYTLSPFINKYLLFDFDAAPEGLYFDIYDSPFNSSSYMLRFFTLGYYLAVPVLWFALRIYFWIGRINFRMTFFAHCLLVYFAVQSFSAMPLMEIPFLLIPILGVFFGRALARVSFLSPGSNPQGYSHD